MKACELIFPSTPPLAEDKLYRVWTPHLAVTSSHCTDAVVHTDFIPKQEAATDRLTGCPTLEDLGVELKPLEDAARYQLKVHRRGRYYAESLGEFAPAPPPPTASEVDESKKVYY